MNAIDISIGVLLVIGLVRGLQKGFILELTALLAIVLGIIGAFLFADDVQVYVDQYLDWESKYIQLTSFILTFLCIVILISLIGNALTKLINLIALGMLNRLLGGLFGVLKMSLIVLVLVLIVSSLDNKIGFLKDKEVIETSVAYAFFSGINEAYLPDLLDYVQENDLLPVESEN
jgi:membrane protein required for colicin V production